VEDFQAAIHREIGVVCAGRQTSASLGGSFVHECLEGAVEFTIVGELS